MRKMKEIRQERGLTQLDVAFALRVTPATVANWEAGRSEPKASQLRALARLLNVSMDDIDFGESDIGEVELKTAA